VGVLARRSLCIKPCDKERHSEAKSRLLRGRGKGKDENYKEEAVRSKGENLPIPLGEKKSNGGGKKNEVRSMRRERESYLEKGELFHNV